ncbi:MULTISPECIES: YaiI/YqxD family protein [unclassified Gilliamella]|uniref:YaiI/YqxD family protein n=1 Tax=unclassified Gilliamella TaxID=2685620 RepID=UPI00130ABF82|nr:MULTISPECIES: YaiI/YqxD family protein [unclassified Gilliamella]MWP48745.1 YaiI/YqxD family protein [Gilliamella sp. Lep-s35]MWP68438.1 YaiI/YqxD family protein [Gilliamella sp. Lep-s5]MWP77016.1 YaiI/YqxD family protein [Gilliamella sp. Lep-s21]
MNIWIDADACPAPIKEILYRAANRKAINTTLVANQRLTIPFSPYIKALQVEKGFDIADNKIIELVKTNDLVITSDIPLAADVLNKGAFVLTPRGEKYTLDTIKERLTIRDFMETMRASGVQSKGPATFNSKDREKFANQLDILLNQISKKV